MVKAARRPSGVWSSSNGDGQAPSHRVLRPSRQAPAVSHLPPGLLSAPLRHASPNGVSGQNDSETDAADAARSALRGRISRRLLGEPTDTGRREAARVARLPFVTARRIWHALGLPELGNREVPFAEADLEVLPNIAEMRKLVALDDELVLGVARAISRSTDRLAVWQTGLIVDAVTARDQVADDEDERLWTEQLTAEERRIVIERTLELADTLEDMLVYSWRRHLVAALGQVADSGDTTEEGEPANVQTVGFADLVDFTSTVQGMSEHKLSSLVSDFEGLASDVVTVHGGRIVKTIGDEVLFSCGCAAAACAIGLDLVEALRGIPEMPSLRVGISTGPVVRQFGDVFGTTVNRASRLTGIADPGTVVVDSPTQTRLANVSGFELLSLENVQLQGLGATEMWELRRASRPTRRGPTAYYPAAN